ncbi:YceI family protein [Phenylobacterium sp.]|jgi:polyisoprenoid-binding protein YceI|uniref:YceI family protein n=1 Tax=Phenylobacterium sp. TaxID=1871053 RepID=UPI002F426D72
MKTLQALALGAAVLSAGPVAAAPTDPAAVQPGTYAIEPRHARVLFAVEHFGVSTWYGDFTHVSGTLKLDPKDPSASRVEVSLPTDSLSTTNAELDATLKGPDWFAAAQFPTVSFRSTKVTVTGPGHASIEGELTLKGVTRALVLEATFKGAAGPNAVIPAYTIGFDLRGHLKRSAFGVSRYLGTVGDDVELIISAPFERKGD